VPIIWAELSRLLRANDTMTRSHAVLAAVSLLGFACAAPRTVRGGGDSQLITEDEIEASRAPTAYEVIQRLHSNFLTYRGETSFDKSKSQPYPTVYIDGQEFGPISSLRNIPASQVATIRLYRSWEATTKFGTGNMGGVIAVTTRQ
jgi:outer membrane cobalamin receptor